VAKPQAEKLHPQQQRQWRAQYVQSPEQNQCSKTQLM
jgi:hypothetical protein